MSKIHVGWQWTYSNRRELPQYCQCSGQGLFGWLERTGSRKRNNKFVSLGMISKAVSVRANR